MNNLILLQKKRRLLNLLLKINQLKIIQLKNKCSKKKKKIWIRICILGRETKREASTMVQEIRFRDLEWYYNYTRMMPESFDELLNLVEQIIRKQVTNFRKPIPPTIRLLITLRYVDLTYFIYFILKYIFICLLLYNVSIYIYLQILGIW